MVAFLAWPKLSLLTSDVHQSMNKGNIPYLTVLPHCVDIIGIRPLHILIERRA